MNYLEKKLQLIYCLRSSGISDPKILLAMEKISRESFLSDNFKKHAFEDIALPILCGQTTSQPSVIGVMLQSLEINVKCKVLEIGTGTGYQTAILSKLARRVYTIEKFKNLSVTAEKVLNDLNIHNVTFFCSDGTLGLSTQAQFDRIIVSAAAEEPPPLLLQQLSVGGIMIIPVGESEKCQKLIKVEKLETSYNYTELMDVRFVPIL